jgi:hypothetical protein
VYSSSTNRETIAFPQGHIKSNRYQDEKFRKDMLPSNTRAKSQAFQVLSNLGGRLTQIGYMVCFAAEAPLQAAE